MTPAAKSSQITVFHLTEAAGRSTRAAMELISGFLTRNKAENGCLQTTKRSQSVRNVKHAAPALAYTDV